MRQVQRVLVGAMVLSTLGAGVYAVGNSGASTQALQQATAAAAVASAQGGTAYAIDLVHSSVLYRVKHVNASWHWGRFNDFSGTFTIDPQDPANNRVEVTIKTDSVDSGNSKRDDHLRSQDFFSAKEFPSISFKSTKSVKTGDNTFDLTGDLTFMGVTKPVTANVEYVGAGEMRGVKKAGIEAKFTIKRSEFGMDKMVGPIGDDVSLIVSFEGDAK